MLSVDALLNLVQRLGREHSIYVNIVAEVREEDVLRFGVQCKELHKRNKLAHRHVSN
jgi:hypothetical protein